MTRRLAALVCACLLGVSGPPALADCAPREFDGAEFTACVFDLDTAELRLFLRDADGALLGSFDRVAAHLPADRRLAAAMNAGMYHEDRAPVGLYIEDGREVQGLVTGDGPGNFGLLPNGVLCARPGGTAAVIETRAYAIRDPDCRHATQSGPLLVIDGALHPRFLADGTSRNIRNGVGVRDAGRQLVLAIADEPVNFHHFARLFRDGLDVDDALYLDGRVSRLYAPGIGRHDRGFTPLGPVLGIVIDRDGDRS